ncbi:MAG TPA: MFS transporter [Bryobacteraceae bacterium]|nr:MFS transporter [Bryobacteraceae bacterium]
MFALASAWNYLDRLTLSAAAPRIMAEFHLSARDYGWLISAFSLSYTFASPAAGWFLDRLGLETGIAWAVGLWSVATAICGWTRSLGQLIAARVFLGIWEAAGVPAAGKVNAIYLEPKDRAIGAAITQVGLSIGGTGATLLVGWMSGWRNPFFVCSVLGFAWIPLWMMVRRNVQPYEEIAPRKETGMLRMLADRRLLTLAAANVLWMGIYTLWSNWTTIFLVRNYGLTTQAASWYAAFPPIAPVIGGFAGGWISRRRIARGMPIVDARVFGALISALGCLVTVLAPLSPTPLIATVAISASYFWVTAGSVNLYTIPVDIWGGQQAGIAISALVFAYGLLQTVISPVIGTLVDRAGFTPVCWLVALPPLGGWLLLRRLNLRAASQPAC